MPDKKTLFSPLIECKSATEDENAKWEMVIEARPTTEDVDSYNEITDGKAFLKAMKGYMKDNPVMMFNHQTDKTIGRVLDYWNDDGPVIKGGIARTNTGMEVAELIRAGVISKMSYMFGNAKYEADNSEDDNTPQRLVDFKIYEIGPVSIPANMGATIQAAKDAGIELNALIKESAQADTTKKKETAMSKKETADMEKSLGDMKSEVEELSMQQQELDDARETHAKTLKILTEKQKELEKGHVGDGEVAELTEKMGSEISSLQKQIRRIRNARNIEGEKESFFSWKAREPGKINVLFDESGRALPEIEQRAYHLFQSPVKYEGDFGRKLKQLRDLHDAVLFADAHFSARSKSNYNITSLKSWNIFRDMVEEFDPEFAKAMASTSTGFGDEWVPTEASAELYDAYRLATDLEDKIPHWTMPSNPAIWPILSSRPKMYRASEATVNNPTELTKSNFGTSKTTFTAEPFAVCVPVSPEFIEDSIIAVVPALRTQLATAMAEGYESLIINGDGTATHQDTAADWAGTGTAYPEGYESGFRKMAIAASQAFDTQDNTAGVGDAAATFGAQDVRYLRELIPSAYGHRASNLVYVTSLSVWLKMLSFDQYSQIGTYGANASWLTGDMPSFDGSPLVITNQLAETLDDAGTKTGSGAGHTHKAIILFNKNAFKIGEKRGIEIEFDKDIRTQQWSFVSTMRRSFQSMDASGAEAVSYGYNIE